VVNRSHVRVLQKLRYDLDDCALWEFMFPSNDRRQQSSSSQQADDEDDADDNADFEVGPLVLSSAI